MLQELLFIGFCKWYHLIIHRTFRPNPDFWGDLRMPLLYSCYSVFLFSFFLLFSWRSSYFMPVDWDGFRVRGLQPRYSPSLDFWQSLRVWRSGSRSRGDVLNPIRQWRQVWSSRSSHFLFCLCHKRIFLLIPSWIIWGLAISSLFLGYLMGLFRGMQSSKIPSRYKPWLFIAISSNEKLFRVSNMAALLSHVVVCITRTAVVACVHEILLRLVTASGWCLCHRIHYVGWQRLSILRFLTLLQATQTLCCHKVSGLVPTTSAAVE